MVSGLLRKPVNIVRMTLRSQEIAWVVSRYGLVEGLGALGVELGKRSVRFAKGKRTKNVPLDGVFGQKLALTFIKLGPTFIKLGQMLALRPDLVGDQVADSLRVLFDQVPPIAFSEIRKIVKSELGRKTFKTAFQSVDPVALGCASLAQVHCATLKDGTPVILKVQKKGVASLVRVDLLILEGFARSADKVFSRFGIWQMYQDFKMATLREIDYREEAKNIKRFRKNYFKLFRDADVVFPRYFPKLTTEKVLTMEPLHGKKVAVLKKGSTVARKAASKSLVAILEQIFDHGFFHADPHAGNLFFMEDEGRIGFIDLGLVGQLDPKDKQKFLKVLFAILKRDKSRLAKALYKLGEPSRRTNYDQFEKAIRTLLDEVQVIGLEKFRLDKLVNRLLGIARKNRILIPNRYVLMLRAFLVIEGVAKSLDPKITLFQVAPPIVARSLLKSYNPLRFFRK